MTFDDFSQVEIKNVGIELAKAREVLNKTSVDFVLDLRTTKHHINAIEEGELRIFYGPPFYLDLLRRYALSLNFSESKIKQLERRVTNQEDQDEEKDAPVDEKVAGGNLKESLSISTPLQCVKILGNQRSFLDLYQCPIRNFV